MTKKILKYLFIVLLIIITLVFSFTIYLFINDYQPDKQTNIQLINNNRNIDTLTDNQFSILTWNIGYCGLGAEEDFFYDGGKNSKPQNSNYNLYQNLIFNFLNKFSFVDFMLLQEVDSMSNRSYKNNQIQLLANQLSEFAFIYAKNYDVKYVPFPIFRPMGKVNSGLMSLSKYKSQENIRYGFDANFSALKRIFLLDRCFALQRFKLKNNKDLIIINIHNSAFDSENILKPIELKTLKNVVINEYNKGNFIIAGGDWNQNPPSYNFQDYRNEWNYTNIDTPVDSNLFENKWLWIFDKNIPTNRFNDKPFKKGDSKTTTIDYFLISPNVECLMIKTINLNFRYSDHQPVLFRFRLKNN